MSAPWGGKATDLGSMLWKSRCVAVCRVAGSGRIRSANPYFHSLTGSTQKVVRGVLVDGFFAPDEGDTEQEEASTPSNLLTMRGDRIPASVEIVAVPETHNSIWLIVPAASVSSLTLLHESVQHTVDELAENLQRVSAASALASPETVERIQFSLTLVEQCAREVRRIGSLLRPDRAEKSCA